MPILELEDCGGSFPGDVFSQAHYFIKTAFAIALHIRF